MTRRKLREVIFKKLYETEITGDAPVPEGSFYGDTFGEGVEADENESEYITNKTNAVLDKKEEIDSCIEQTSSGWKVSRMSRVDLSILRLAVYEMLYDEDIPVGVAVNEAVELAKEYGTDDSSAFINGILGNISRKKGLSD